MVMHRLLRFFRRPEAPGPVVAVVEIPRPTPARLSPVLAALKTGWRTFRHGLSVVDHGFASLAIPFGVTIRDPRKRYPVLLGVFAGLFLLGALPIPIVSLPALAIAYLGLLAIGRAWVLNEKERTHIVKKLKATDPDQLPDLRSTALVSALLLLILFPLIFQQCERFFHLYKVDHQPTFMSWLWFALDKTYLKSLPDWSILYGVHISSIEFGSHWGRHLVLLTRLTFDFILLQGLARVLAIRSTIREAVAVITVDPEMAVRLGRRAIKPLTEKLHDPDRVVRGAAANALTQLGAIHALQAIIEEKTQKVEA